MKISPLDENISKEIFNSFESIPDIKSYKLNNNKTIHYAVNNMNDFDNNCYNKCDANENCNITAVSIPDKKYCFYLDKTPYVKEKHWTTMDLSKSSPTVGFF